MKTSASMHKNDKKAEDKEMQDALGLRNPTAIYRGIRGGLFGYSQRKSRAAKSNSTRFAFRAEMPR